MAFKPLYILILLLFFLNACDDRLSSTTEKPTGEEISYKNITMARADSSEVPPAVRQSYRTDSEVITALYINKQDSTQIELPSQLIEIIYHGFFHIFNSDIEEAQEVTRKYKIHRAVAAGVSRKLLLTFFDNQSWQQIWEEGNLFTGNQKIDNLLEKYNLILDEFFDWTSFPWNGATFHSKKSLK